LCMLLRLRIRRFVVTDSGEMDSNIRGVMSKPVSGKGRGHTLGLVRVEIELT